MVWRVRYSETAKKFLKKLNPKVGQVILEYMSRRIAVLDDPKTAGRALRGELGGFWRYRVGDYRVICELKDSELVILALVIGHRSNVYAKRNRKDC